LRLAAVVRKSEIELNAALDRLTAAGLLSRQGLPPHASYLFKHALVDADRCLTLSEEYGFRQWRNPSRITCAVMLAPSKTIDAATIELDDYRAHYHLGVTVVLALSCEALLLRREFDLVTEIIEEIMEGVMRHFYLRALTEQRMGDEADGNSVDAAAFRPGPMCAAAFTSNLRSTRIQREAKRSASWLRGNDNV
jgi:hypothetical protein